MYMCCVSWYNLGIVEKVYLLRVLVIFKKEGVAMPLTESQKQARYNYAKKSLKRIPLDVQKEKYEEIKAAAEKANESVNGYIKKAIDERMERDAE